MLAILDDALRDLTGLRRTLPKWHEAIP